MTPPALGDWSLAVGIDHYPGLTRLAGAEADARRFHRWATTAGGVPPANARLIVSSDFSDAPSAAAARPAAQEVAQFIEMLRKAAAANDARDLGLVAGRRIYLFFSGHGFSPSLDQSCLLMANAERDTPHNFATKAWADRLYENGLFREILLFQDACREPFSDVERTPPYLRRSPMPGAGERRRFYAFAAKTPLLALEKPVDGAVRGIFSATLMAGLNGGARDPRTGDITALQLKQYLVSNMKALLTQQELDDEDLSQRPEVLDLDPFVIVAGTGQGIPEFPVAVALPPPCGGAEILDGFRAVVARSEPGRSSWQVTLPVGLYELVRPGLSSALFKVTGTLDALGEPEVVHVG